MADFKLNQERGTAEVPRFSILGLGNILLGDEGVGVRVVERIAETFEAHPDVEVVDGGTSGIELLPHFRRDGVMIIIDAVKPHQAAGRILRLEDGQVPSFLDAKLSPHQIGLPDLLATASLLDQTPKKVVFLGVEPWTIETGIELSPGMHEKVPELVVLAVGELAKFGIQLRKK